MNYQGPDHGTQYRSAIFYADEGQRKVAEEYIRALGQAKVFSGKIVTQLVPLDAFYPAEEYHQDYLRRNPSQPYIVYWDLPKIAELEKKYPQPGPSWRPPSRSSSAGRTRGCRHVRSP